LTQDQILVRDYHKTKREVGQQIGIPDGIYIYHFVDNYLNLYYTLKKSKEYRENSEQLIFD
jgi:hypothetical protein